MFCDHVCNPDEGHSDSQSRSVPTLVKDISGVGQVACGSSHTIAVAQDGRTVWSFGGGDNGEPSDIFRELWKTSMKMETMTHLCR